MENSPVWILVSELLEGGYGYSVSLGTLEHKETWILENNKKEVVAYQIVESGKAPFYNVYCLMEKHSETNDKKSTPEVVAFLIKGN